MPAMKPNQRIWAKINDAILDENAGETLVTMISGMSMLLVQAGVCRDEMHGRIHLAAICMLPNVGPRGEELMDALKHELQLLDADITKSGHSNG